MIVGRHSDYKSVMPQGCRWIAAGILVAASRILARSRRRGARRVSQLISGPLCHVVIAREIPHESDANTVLPGLDILTGTKGRDKGSENPDWSPDGKKIAFQSTRDGKSKHWRDNFDMHVMDADGARMYKGSPSISLGRHTHIRDHELVLCWERASQKEPRMPRPKGRLVVFLVVALTIIAPLARAQVAGQSERKAKGRQESDAFVNWARKNAIPITTTEPGKGFKDLQPIKKIIGKARVVALGESVHETHEFNEFRHRMLEFLVKEMSFTAFAMETGFAEAVKINDYVLGRVEEPKQWKHWFTWGFGEAKELHALLRWMRRYNEDPSHARKLHFYGIDLAVNDGSPLTAVEGALAYLNKVDPEYAASSRQKLLPLVEHFLGSEGGGRLDKYKKLPLETRDAYTGAIADLIARFETERVGYVARSSQDSYEWAYHLAIAARQLDIAFRVAALPGSAADNQYAVRDRAMADNVLWALEREGPNGRILVFAHNFHIQKANPRSESPPMGLFLDSMMGKDYVTMGTTFYQGAESGWASYQTHTKEPAESGSLDGELARVGLPMFIIDIRSASKEKQAYKWLNQERKIHESVPSLEWEVNPIQAWDAILFIKEISPARRQDAPK
ncbi:MAG: erythromycin esterase family protein [Armatimonadetes bacterium]|nr:erythromycin esterase family protein [Armatimonadota bacterium]